jgi:hypothetical protein
MTPGKRTSPEAQQQVLTYLEMKKPVKWISSKTGLGREQFWRIKKRGDIQHSNEYKSTPGRPPKVSRYEKRKSDRLLDLFWKWMTRPIK